MAARNDDELDSLLCIFDHIYQDFKSVLTEIQMVRCNWSEEMKQREALEIACHSIKQENERLTKLYTESFNSMGEQLQRRTKLQSLKQELLTLRNQHLSLQDEHVKAMELLKQEHAAKIGDLEAKTRGLLLENATNQATINHLRQDLAAHKTHMQTLANRLDSVSLEVEAKYNMEIQDLKDCLLVEQEEKNELHLKLKDLEKQFLLSKTKQAEQHQDLASNRLVETLKTRIMKMRKENEILRRKLSLLE